MDVEESTAQQDSTKIVILYKIWTASEALADSYHRRNRAEARPGLMVDDAWSAEMHYRLHN